MIFINTHNVKFYIPGFYTHHNLNVALITMLKQYPEYFVKNATIGAVYDAFPGSIWNGGRYIRPKPIASEKIEEIISLFNDLGVPIRFTFTNCLIDAQHLHDKYCNLIMDIADNGMNEVIVNSSVLEDYLRSKYPDFKYIASTTKCERDINQIDKMCTEYDLVVTHPKDNANEEFLRQLRYKDKIELLVNSYCYPYCNNEKEHYSEVALAQINGSMKGINKRQCGAYWQSVSDILKYPTVIKADEIYGKYIDMGFSNFKLDGRSAFKGKVIDFYIYYLVKPQYKDLVKTELHRLL